MARTSTSTQPTIPAPEKIPIALTVNGVETHLEVAPWTTLLDALREHLDLTGTKKGVNRLPNLTPHRLPILTPLSGGVCW